MIFNLVPLVIYGLFLLYTTTAVNAQDAVGAVNPRSATSCRNGC